MPTQPPFRATMRRISKAMVARMSRVFGGVIGTYKFADGGATITDVVCLPFGTKDQVRVSGASVLDRYESYVIPVTDTWPGVNTPKPYDVVTFEGVVGWVDTISTDNLGAIYRIKLKYREDI